MGPSRSLAITVEGGVGGERRQVAKVDHCSESSFRLDKDEALRTVEHLETLDLQRSNPVFDDNIFCISGQSGMFSHKWRILCASLQLQPRTISNFSGRLPPI